MVHASVEKNEKESKCEQTLCEYHKSFCFPLKNLSHKFLL